MNSYRVLVKNCYEQGKSPPEIFRLLKDHGIKLRFVQYWCKRFREHGGVEDAKRSGRPRSVRTKQLVKTVRDRVRRNPERRCRRLSQELKVSTTSMHRVLRIDLGLKCYKKRKLHGLSNTQKQNRLIRSRKLIKFFNPARWKKLETLIFSDEKIFNVQQSYNSKNDVVYGLSFQHIPENLRTVQRFQKSNGVMVWGALSKRAKLPLVFVNPGVKINKEFYQKEILDAELKVWADATHGFGNWTFQQDSAPAHTAKVVQAWLQKNCPNFITVDE